MVLIDIRRKEQTDDGYLYEVVRIKQDGTAAAIPNPNGKPWNIAEVYHFIDNCTHPYNLPLKLEDHVMNDFVAYADKAESEEKKSIHESYKKKCGTGGKVSTSEFERMLSGQ